MTTLSICIPSNAALADAKTSIESALALLPYGGVEVVVSDNSRDPAKKTFFESCDLPGFRYLNSPFDDGYQNWCHVIDSARGEFLMILGDDDVLVSLPGFRTSALDNLAGKIGVRPSHAMFSSGKGVYRPTNFAVEGSRAVDRVQDFMIKNGGSNVTLHSAVRSDAWRNLTAGYLAHHPTRAGFTDWSLTFALVSTAPMTQESNLLYLYNSTNWDSEEAIRASNKRGVAAGGLPPQAEQIQMALQAVDSFVAIARLDSTVSFEEKFDAGMLVSTAYFNSFINALQKRFRSGKQPSQKWLQTAKIALAPTCPAEQLLACLVIIEMWLPQLRDPYQKFFHEVLGPEMANRAGLTG